MPETEPTSTTSKWTPIIQIIAWTAVSTALLYGCTNSFLNNLSLPTSNPTPTSSAVSDDSEVLASAVIATPAGTTNSGAVTTLFFDSAQSTAPISNHCNSLAIGSSTTAKPCNCQFTWNQITGSTGTNSLTGLPNAGITIAHHVLTALSSVQPNEVTCPAPSLYNSEITIGTQINITVVAGNNNPDTGLFTVSTLSYTKPSTTTTGSFSDAQGNLFENIMRYSCYGLFQRGTSIKSAQATVSNPSSGAPVTVYLASQFCLTSIGSTTSPSAGCPSPPPPNYSSENYYYDFYIPSSELGHINAADSGYICPRVAESLSAGNTSGATSPNSFYPLDSTFALSIAGSSTFNYGVVANSIIGVAGDQASSNSTCPAVNLAGNTGTNTTTNNNTSTQITNGPVQACLGYAAPMNSDGTCPYFTNAFGQIQLTYRLRKYIALYPKMFDTNGKPYGTQGLNTIYVLDRPVEGPSTTSPLKPYTMRGPKPCPFAFFDTKATANTNPNNTSSTSYGAYVATNNANWSGKNIDGIEFPNTDSASTGSCSAAIPFINAGGQFSIQTININNGVSGTPGALSNAPAHMYVRPSQPYLAHYEEDTTFQACAPMASPFQDPPLHFVRDPYSGNVAWCAESYPTQNNNVQWIDPPTSPTPSPSVASGMIPNYTSHTVKNSANTACTATLPTIPSVAGVYNYPNFTGLPQHGIPAYARHSSSLTSLSWDSTSSANASETCDRTVIVSNASTTIPSTQWPEFPLLAPPNDIENTTFGIQTDTSYHCLITYDNNGGKTNLYSPSDGCCSKNVVSVPTGTKTLTAAHLEPTTPCNVPSY